MAGQIRRVRESGRCRLGYIERKEGSEHCIEDWYRRELLNSSQLLLILEFKVDEWENEFIIAQVFDYSHQSKGDLIGSAVIPLTLYAGNRNCEICSYPLVLPDEVGGLGSPKSDMFLQISLLDADGSPVEEFYW